MSYSSIVEMANSASLLGRITACVAADGISNPEQWTQSYIWKLVSSPEWDTKWDYAKATYTLDANPDTGARNGVISDGDILSAVQAVVAQA